MEIKQFLTEMEFYNSKRNSKVQWYPLQLQILTKMDHNKRIFVFDEVGAGKTIEAGLAIMKTCLEQENAKILIITHGILIEQFKNEIHNKFGIDFKNVNGIDNRGSSDPISLFNNKPCKFIITNPSASNIAKCRMELGWDLVIIDEAHNFMNNGSLRSINIKEIKAKKVIMFTATPIRNRLEELQSLIDLSQEITDDENEIDLPVAQDFLEQYNERSCWMRNFKAVIKKDYRQRKVDVWKYDYRDSISDNDIASKITHKHYCNLGNIFLLWGADKSEMELRPKVYLGEKYGLDSLDDILDIDRKANILINEIEKIKKKNLKTIIFCRRRATIKYLEYICSEKGFNTKSLSGEQRKDERNEIINQAKNGDIDIFIIMDKIGESGLNLPEYNYVINYELPYSPADLEQRLGRIDRLVSGGENTDKPIHSVYMIHEENVKDETCYDNRLFYKNMYKFLPTIITQIPSKNVIFDSGMILECIDKMQIEKQKQLKTIEQTEKLLNIIKDIGAFKRSIIYANEEDLYSLRRDWKIDFDIIIFLWSEKDCIREEKNDWDDIKEMMKLKSSQIDRDLEEVKETIKLNKQSKDKLKDIGNGIFYYVNNMLQIKKLEGDNFIEGIKLEIERGNIYPILESFQTSREEEIRKEIVQNRLKEMSENIKGLHNLFENGDIRDSKAVMNKILENKYMQSDLLELYKDEILSITNMCEEKLDILIKVIEEYSNHKLLKKKSAKKKIKCLFKINYSGKQVEMIISRESQRNYHLYGEDNYMFVFELEKNNEYIIRFVKYYSREYFGGLDVFGMSQLYEKHKEEILLMSLQKKYIHEHNYVGYLLFYGNENCKALPISKKNNGLNEFDVVYDSDNKDIYLSAINYLRNHENEKCKNIYSVESIDKIILSPQIPGKSNQRFYTGWKPVETLLNYVIDITANDNEAERLEYLKENKIEKVRFYKDRPWHSTIEVMKLIFIKRLIKDVSENDEFECLDKKARSMKKDEPGSENIVQQFKKLLKETLVKLRSIQQDKIVKLYNESSYRWGRCGVIDNLEEHLTRKCLLWKGCTVKIQDQKIEFILNDINTFNDKWDKFIYIEEREILFQAIRVGSCLISDRKKLSNNFFTRDANALLGKEEFFRRSYKEIIKHEVNKRGEDILIYIIDKKEAILFINKEIKEYTCDDIQGKSLEKLENTRDDSWYDDRYYDIWSLVDWVFGKGVRYKDDSNRRYSSAKGVFLLEYICKLEESFKMQS